MFCFVNFKMLCMELSCIRDTVVLCIQEVRGWHVAKPAFSLYLAILNFHFVVGGKKELFKACSGHKSFLVSQFCVSFQAFYYLSDDSIYDQSN